jgi:hypothetical protein
VEKMIQYQPYVFEVVTNQDADHWNVWISYQVQVMENDGVFAAFVVITNH